MQSPSSSFISTVSLSLTLTKLPTSMESNQITSTDSFSYSLRLNSFGAESFIEFDPKLLSMRWSIKAQEEEEEEEEAKNSYIDSYTIPKVASNQKSTVLKNHKFRFALRNFLWISLVKICRKIAGKSSARRVNVDSGRGNRVFHVDAESSIQDAVLHCKNSSLSSLMDEEV
ncbi:uncharacterized protein A4U43_C05F18870 [Asparagus officinalis]|uniref:Uncharacterized protein n=1 Tax=Asparagus officinalis TaxID=4686 RepID=A0A5P1EY23_ASPOF|nr:uncharacterized protein A4U43_C05F18870 [Asparagus officinalis]